ncbi:hypothetical protein A3Q56_05560 [Intoshia linei]|uniref:Branched-chain-amino-acid aminotransferase n=1 Tax=Intoshia linei TaxID=1819745 RepID=A0A177AXJ3_9BILA|nr:hypothetical protein A3Q56_05560 [Intoshia linei]
MIMKRQLNQLLSFTKRNYEIRNYANIFKANDVIDKSERSKRELPEMKNVLFGHLYSDNMLTIDWSKKNGWEKPIIHPMRPLQLHPGSKVFHYAPECFEGFKAYYQKSKGSISLFRPNLNVARFKESGERVCLPSFDDKELLKCIMKLIKIEKRWVPKEKKSSLYIRPTLIGTDQTLGINVSNNAKLYVIMCPVSAYYPTGFDPISLYADTFNVRAWKGGSGGFKIGANYASSVLPSYVATTKHNCQQILWLYGVDRQLTEVGTMNLFVYWINEEGEKELITPDIKDGIILPGIIRKSILEMTKRWKKFKVSEKNINMNQIIKALNENRIFEMFGSGTACVVSPIKKIKYENSDLTIPLNIKEALFRKIESQLFDIQYGNVKSDWNVHVCGA